MLQDGEFVSHLTVEELDFLFDLRDYLRVNGKPPPLRESSHAPVAGLFYVPPSISVDAPEENEDYGLNDFKLQDDILRLIDSGETDIWRLDICLAEYSLGDILAVVNRLVGLGVIKDVGGDLSLNYADLTFEEFTPVERTAASTTAVLDVSREIVRLVGAGISDYDLLRSHFPSVPTYRFSAVFEKLLEDGTVIQQPDGELVLGG